MILFRFTFPKKDICTQQKLYYRTSSQHENAVMYNEQSCQLCFGENAQVSFDTYFNCFSYSQYKLYTNAKDIGVCLYVKGKFKVSLYLSKCGEVVQLLSEQTVQCYTTEKITIHHSLSQLDGEGFLYIQLTALANECVFSGGYYECYDVCPSNVKLAICICSYNKEEHVYRNAEIFGNSLSTPENSFYRENITLVIVDNGGTLIKEKILCNDTLLFYNRNLGGSGGFTRGLIEVAACNKNFTHICLMDDDLRFDPETVYKTFSFLQILRSEYKIIVIGGTMLELERPYYQYEMGGVWTGKSIVNLRTGVDVRLAKEVLANERQQKADYNAWWYTCMPITAVEQIGLPMPFFIKGDDMDYGMRMGEEIVRINGLAVWHEGFPGKYSGVLEYYIKRNELVLNALHSKDFGMFKSTSKLLFACGKQLVMQRYCVVDFILQAYEDFLKGVDFFLQVDGELLNAQLMQRNIPMLDDGQLLQEQKRLYPNISFCNKPVKRPHRFWKYLTLYSYLIPTAFYDESSRYRQVEIGSTCPEDFYKAQCVLQYNSATNKGFITRLDKIKAVHFAIKFAKICLKMLFGYNKAVESFQTRSKEITSEEFWRKQLNLDL